MGVEILKRSEFYAAIIFWAKKCNKLSQIK